MNSVLINALIGIIIIVIKGFVFIVISAVSTGIQKPFVVIDNACFQVQTRVESTPT